jgi:hypothetical protein
MERLDRVMFFPCSLNQSHTTLTETNGSSHSWKDGTVTMTSGSAPNSIAEICGYLSVFLCHEPLVSVTLNLSFSTPVAGTRQLAGVGDSENGAFVGFDGTRFGARFVRGGRRQYWTMQIGTACTTSGALLITLADTTFTVGVGAGMTVTQIAYAIYLNSSIRNANIKSSFCFDYVVLWSDATSSLGGSSVLAAFNGTSTGVSGTCVSSIASVPATEEWVYDASFNGGGYPNVEGLLETDLNVYRLTFSRWSTGVVSIAVMDPSSDDFITIHTWSPGSRGFNTSMPYTPTIRTENGSTSATMATSTSMASISTGTPSTSYNYTPFNTVFTALNIPVISGAYRVVGVIQNPMLQNGVRNRMVVNVTKIEYAVSTPRPVRIFTMIGGLTNIPGTMNRHLSWNAVNICTPSTVSPMYVQGGLEFSNSYAGACTDQISIDFDQLWLMPSIVIYVCVKAATDPVTCSIDATVHWQEH